MKHTFLIIAHNEFSVLQLLVSQLDHEGCDIFIHFDKKVESVPQINAKSARLSVLADRIDTRWGDYSQIQTELLLMRTAWNTYVGEDLYNRYFHILSGTHLLLRDWADFNSYFEALAGKVVYAPVPNSDYQTDLKLRHFNMFVPWMKVHRRVISVWSQRLWRVAIILQDKMKIKRNSDITFVNGSNWVSLPSSAIEIILNQEKSIKKVFNHTFCGDEFFIPTIINNSALKPLLIVRQDYLFTEFAGSAYPRTFPISQYEKLKDTGCIWARKFTCVNDGE